MGKYCIALGFSWLLAIAGYSQQRSNKGKEFWLGYGHNVLFTADNPINAQNLVLYISAAVAAKVEVSVNGTGWSQTVNVPAGSVDFSVIIPKSGIDDARIRSEGKFDRGIHIVADQEIVVYAHQFGIQSSAATMLFPVEAYGYSYISVNYDQVTNFGNAYSWMFVVAAEDNTRLEFVPSDSTEGGWEPGKTYTVDLNKGQIYNLFGKQTGNNTSKDLTGSKVKAVAGADGQCHPFATFSGSSRIILCPGNGGEIMWQQIFPRSAWGNNYLTHTSINNITGAINQPFLNFFRVVVNDPATVVKRNGTVLTGLNAKGFYEFTTTDADFIEADQPVMVTQYMHSTNQCTGALNPPRGDPEMFILSPLEQGITSATFYNTRNQNITVNYLDLIVHKNGLPSLKLDGVAFAPSSYKPHPNNADYVYAARRLLGAGRQYKLTCDSPFVAKVYGLGDFESYGYLAGTLINNLNALPDISNQLKTTILRDTFTCPNSPFFFQTRLAYKATSITWKLTEHAGFINGADTTVNNPIPSDSVIEKGRKYYLYTLNRPYLFTTSGRYIINSEATSPDIDICDKREVYTHEVVVKDAPALSAAISYSGCLSDTAIFTGSAAPWFFPPVRYYWRYDDGSVDSTGNVSRRKLHTGSNAIRFSSVAENGCISDTSFVLSPSIEPKSAFSLSATGICLGDSVLITDQSSVTVGTIATRWYNFGDGTPIVQRNNGSAFYHKPTAAGTYTIKQWVQTAAGCRSDTAAQTLIVAARPSATYALPQVVCEASDIMLTPVSNSPGITNYQWDLGNGLVVNTATPTPVSTSYSYPNNGVLVTLTVTAGGCSSQPFRQPSFNVMPRPQSTFVVLSDTLCTGKVVSMNGQASVAAGTIQRYLWLAANDSIGNSPGIQHQFNTAGNIPIRFIAVSAAGCADTTVQQVNIDQTPTVDAGPTITVPQGASGILQASVAPSGNYTYEWQPPTGLSDAFVLRPTVTPLQDQLYQIVVSGATGLCTATDTVRVVLLEEIRIPNAFSPNGDGINDRWQIFGLSAYPYASVRVFDRYGRIVFQSNGYNTAWDGARNGNGLPAGVYYYIIDKGDKSERQSGSVTILR